ncbi:hypothetical protein AB0O07_12545 [Streptomyces sp. NPDC093085]
MAERDQLLGPLTERRRAELVEGLAAFGGRRWSRSVSFTTLPVDR